MLAEAIRAAPPVTTVSLRNCSADTPAFLFIADGTLHRKSACSSRATEPNPKEQSWSQPSYLWNPPPVHSLPVREERPINRLFFVGRSFTTRTRQDGPACRRSVEVPFYFTSTANAGRVGATVAYPRNPGLSPRDGTRRGHRQAGLPHRGG